MKAYPVTNKQAGFSLVEILVFISVLTVALVALIGSVAYSMIVLDNARYQLFATRYSEELAEWFKYQRETEGYDFIATNSSVEGSPYCFNEEDINDTWPASAACTDYALDNFFKREATLVLDDINKKIVVEVITSYYLLNKEREVTIEFNFNNYDL